MFHLFKGLFFIILLKGHFIFSGQDIDYVSRSEIYEEYRYCSKLEQMLNPFKQHMLRLRLLARECSSAIEFGVLEESYSLSILLGLSDNELGNKRYTNVDKTRPEIQTLKKFSRWARGLNIKFIFLNKNTCLMEPQSFDLLFIDSDHRYAHLSLELENMHSKIEKYIFLHHTGTPWGYRDEQNYFIDDFVYPEWIEKTKQGLKAAVDDFLNRHPEWEKYEENANSHGFTILKRIK